LVCYAPVPGVAVLPPPWESAPGRCPLGVCWLTKATARRYVPNRCPSIQETRRAGMDVLRGEILWVGGYCCDGFRSCASIPNPPYAPLMPSAACSPEICLSCFVVSARFTACKDRILLVHAACGPEPKCPSHSFSYLRVNTLVCEWSQR
jgi:hypothetical protein